MTALKTVIRLLLVLIVTVMSCLVAAKPTQDTPVNPQLMTNTNTDSSSRSTNPADDMNQPTGLRDVPTINMVAVNINTNDSHVRTTKIDPEIGPGPSCHQSGTRGIIRFIVIYATLLEARAQLYQFSLVYPNHDLVAAAAAAKTEGISTGNDSSVFADAAASLHMGNVSLQLLRVTEYSSRPGLFSFDERPERIHEPLTLLMKSLTDDIPESIRPMTCLLLRFNFSRTGHFPWHSPKFLLDNARSVIKSMWFRDPGMSYLAEDAVEVMHPDDEISLNWLAVNFLLGNFALEASDINVRHRRVVTSFEPNITTNPVMDVNYMAIETVMESVTIISNHSNGEDGYQKDLYLSPYAGLGTRESVMRFVKYNFSDDSIEENGQLVLRTYSSTCLAANYTGMFGLGPMGLPMIGLGRGGSSCLARAKEIVRNFGVLNWLNVSQAVYAMSDTYDLLRFLLETGITNVTHSSNVCPTVNFPCDAYISTVGEIESATQTVCVNPPRDGVNEPYYCFNLAALDAVLRHSLNLSPETAVIGMARKMYIGWPLGLSLLHLQKSMNRASNPFDWMVARAAVRLPASCKLVWTVAIVLMVMKFTSMQQSR